MLIQAFVASLLLGVAAPNPEPTAEIHKLTIYPAAEPVPALRYRLLPELRELTPGNAALFYQRAHSPELLAGYQRQPEYKDQKWHDWLQVPLKELPRDKVRAFLPQAALKELELAARREYCDWELTPRLRKDGIAMLLPEVSIFREFAALLSLKARLEIAEGKYDEAARTLQTGFTLARHMGEGSTLIHSLVGMALAQVLAARVQELMEQTDGPNLYWALTTLPHPFVDMRRPMQGERLFMDSAFPGIRDALADRKAPPLSPELVRASLDKLIAGLGELDPDAVKLKADVLATKAHDEAKRFLTAQGWTKEQVEAIPAIQAVLMHEVYNHDRIYDDLLKWFSLPYWEARPGLQEVERQLKAEKAKGAGMGTTLATLLMPAVMKVKLAHTRTERRLAALRCIEAIRLYAAAHDGKLPAALSDIRMVPVPNDPLTGKPFEYEAQGDHATLIGPAPADEKPTPVYTVRYELTIKRK